MEGTSSRHNPIIIFASGIMHSLKVRELTIQSTGTRREDNSSIKVHAKYG